MERIWEEMDLVFRDGWRTSAIMATVGSNVVTLIVTPCCLF